MKRTQLKSKDVNKLLEKYNVNLSKKDQVELIEDEFRFIQINKKLSFFYHDNNPIPTLKYLQDHDCLKKITVDMGAVKFVINGADIMRPGITKIDDGIETNDYVVVIDENNKKPLAVGICLLNSEDLKKTKEGKHIKNIHYVGDKIWNYS
jgi:PUA-domain protein